MRIWVRRLTCDSVRVRVVNTGAAERFAPVYPDWELAVVPDGSTLER
jgi:hypothetical protein